MSDELKIVVSNEEDFILLSRILYSNNLSYHVEKDWTRCTIRIEKATNKQLDTVITSFRNAKKGTVKILASIY